MFKVFKTTGIEGNYNISANPTFVNNNCWAIYPAKHKTTKKAYSVWQFQKRDWETRLTNEGIINKNNKKLVLSDIYENIRLFIGNQAKLKHPNFLTVIEPLEDHKNRILFVTEYVVSDLNNIDKTDLDEIMITKGLLQVFNGLKFLHDSVHSVDLNINPSSIVITENCDWKICGLSFLENIANGMTEKFVDPIDSRMPSFLSIDFRFSSPNLLLKHNVDYIDDIFSVCCLIYFLFNNGDYMIKCHQSSGLTDYERQIKKLNQILSGIRSNNTSTKHAFFIKIPDNYYKTFLDVLENSQESNTDVIQLKKVITISDLINSNIFNNELIKILNVIDEFTTLPLPEKITFLKKLKPEIEKFPKPLLINKFIPILINAVDADQFKKSSQQPTAEVEELIIESCDNLIILSKKLSQLTFSDKVFPFILTLLKRLQFDGFKILLLKNLPIIQGCLNASIDNNSSNESFQKFSLDVFNKCINEQNSLAVQELALMNLKTVLQFQSYSVVTSDILPKICTIYSTTTSLKIKNLTLSSFITMIAEVKNNALDDFLIVEKILPLIYNTSSANYANTKFTNNILKLYNCIFDKLAKSTNKTFNSQGSETELYDIMMNLGFNIWKIAKLVTNKQDLNVAYSTWGKVEKYLKKDLDSKVTEPGPSESVKTSRISSPPPSLPTEPANFAANSFSTTNKPQPVANDTNNDIFNSKERKPFTSRSESYSVMTANKSLSLNQPKNSSNVNLSFGQTNTTPSLSNGSVTGGIDWSKANSFTPMQPTNTSKAAAANTKISNGGINWNSSASETNGFGILGGANGSNPMGGYGVMKPTTKRNKAAEEPNADDDGWGDFAVGSTTSNNGWNDILL